MKTILFVHHVSAIGGASYCLLSILKALDRHKFKPVVLLKQEGPLVDELRKLDIDVMFFPQMAVLPYNRSLWRLKTILAYYKIKRSVTEFEKLLYNLKGVEAVYLNTSVMAPYREVAKKCGKKTIIHIREHWPLDEHTKQLSWIQSAISKFADEVIAINGYSASMIPDKEATIVYDWIDFTDRYEPYPFDKIFNEETSKLKVFVYTGGIQKIKGAYEVLSTFVHHQTSPENRLLVVGVNPKINANSFRQKLKILLAKIGIKSYEVKIKELINSDYRIKCIPPTYALKDILQQAYCNLSFFTMPHANLALAENLVLGTPSVAALTPESLEYSEDGTLSCLCKINDIADYKNKLKELELTYPKLKASIMNENNKIADKFSVTENASKIDNLLTHLFVK